MTNSRRSIALAAIVTVALVALMLVTGGAKQHPKTTSPRTAGSRHQLPDITPRTATQPGYLAPGSDPRVLPGPIVIADKGNNRLLIVTPTGQVRSIWPRRGDLRDGQTFYVPDDAFVTPDGKHIIATQEDDFTISEISLAKHRIVWHYGVPGVAGSASGFLWNPDDAMMLRDGTVVAADIKNCRLVWISAKTRSVVRQQGGPGLCYHAPPYAYGSPNGVFPLRDGNFLVTEINRDWVDEISAAGVLFWSVHPPGVNYPSDTNQAGADRYVTADYSYPGQVVIFNRVGQLLWRYGPAYGTGALDHPSLAEVLPSGDVLVTDDGNDRVVVIDPHTSQIVWQYGVRGVPGRAPGYLHRPDGVDLLPPYSYADRYQS